MKGKKGRIVRNANTIRVFANERKCVIGEGCWLRKPIPAAVVMNMTLAVVLDGIRDGMWEYIPRKKEEG